MSEHKRGHKVSIMKTKILSGNYGDYELVFASEEIIEKYTEPCLESMSAHEIYETWQLYHLSVKDLLEKVFSAVRLGRCEAYFLLCHNICEGNTEVVGIGGFGALADIETCMNCGEQGGNALNGKTGEIWFMGESLAGHKRFLVRHGKEIIAKILTVYPTLINAAAAWNYPALHLVKFLGFTVGEKAIYIGMDSSLYKYFYITKE